MVVVIVATAGMVVPLKADGDAVGLVGTGARVGRGDGDVVGSAVVGTGNGAGVASAVCPCGAGVGCSVMSSRSTIEAHVGYGITGAIVVGGLVPVVDVMVVEVAVLVVAVAVVTVVLVRTLAGTAAPHSVPDGIVNAGPVSSHSVS